MEWLPGPGIEARPRALRPLDEQAITAFLDASLDALLAGEELPDARRGLADVLGSALTTGSAVTTGDQAPARAECPGGNGQYWREQRRHGSHTYWVWVCECW